MRVVGIALIVSSLVATAALAQSDSNQALDQILESAFREYLELDPSLGFLTGELRFGGRLTVAIDPANREARKRLFRTTVQTLSAVDRDQLDRDHQLYLDASLVNLQGSLSLLEFPDHQLPLLPGFGIPSRFAQMGSGSADLDYQSLDDYDRFYSRIADFERWIELAIGNLRAGLKAGVVHSRSTVLRALQEILDHAHVKEPRSSIFARPLDSPPPGLSETQQEAVSTRLETAILERISPAYSRLAHFLRIEYLPKARNTISLSALPDGLAWYRALVAFYTTTDLTPEEIFAYGDREVDRILGRMKVLQRHPKRGSSWLSGEAAILAGFARIEKKVQNKLPELFGRIPKTPFEIRPVEAYRADTTAGAFYQRPSTRSDAPGQPGVFYVNLSRGGFDMSTAESLFLHEALPGHHFQISLAQERDDLPSFLRYGYFGAFVEGWGLYSESLGEELGLYRTTDRQLGRLRYELGRASRLVADVGIHYKGWSRQEAITYLTRRNLNWAIGEIDRYTSMPAQALSYKVGERKFQELRTIFMAGTSSRSALREFHDLALEHGPLPLTSLEAKIRERLGPAPPAEDPF